MPIKNYTTKIAADRTVAELSQLLARKGASGIMTSFGEDAKPVALKWRIKSKHGPLSFSMPVRIDAVYEVMTQQRVMATDAKSRREQAYRTAWRIIKDWVEAQLALLETEMVDFEEVFMPYILSGRETLYQAMSEGRVKALPAAEGNEDQ